MKVISNCFRYTRPFVYAGSITECGHSIAWWDGSKAHRAAAPSACLYRVMYDVSKNFQPRNKKCPIKRISKSLRTVFNIINYRSGSTRVTNYHTTYKDRLSRIVYTRNRPSRNAPSQSHGISKKSKNKTEKWAIKEYYCIPVNTLHIT